MNRAFSADPFTLLILGALPEATIECRAFGAHGVKPLCQMALDYFAFADANLQISRSGPSTPQIGS
jgi:hypothetical protein